MKKTLLSMLALLVMASVAFAAGNQEKISPIPETASGTAFTAYSGVKGTARYSTALDMTGFYVRTVEYVNDSAWTVRTGILVVQESIDGTNFSTVKDDSGTAMSFTANTVTTWHSAAPYVRVGYTRGAYDAATGHKATVKFRAVPNK